MTVEFDKGGGEIMLEAGLPALPPAKAQQKLEVTDMLFVAWDIMQPWGITAIAFRRESEGELTVWTPGQSLSWMWRGPRHISQCSIGILVQWLGHKDDLAVTINSQKVEAHTEVSDKTIWIQDPDPNREGGLGIRKLDNGGFELSLMMAGLRRGGAYIGKVDGERLRQWLNIPAENRQCDRTKQTP